MNIWKISFIIFLSIINSGISAQEEKKAKILVSKVIEHPALDSTVQGIIDALANSGYIIGKNLELKVESAQASPVLAQQIAGKFVFMNPDIVVGVGTVSAQSFSKYAQQKKVKLVFSTVTDPVGASLISNLNQSNENISGVSNFIALKPQLELFKKILPNIKKLGILYNPGELNSISIVKELEQLCPNFGITLVKQSISKTADVAQNTLKLAQDVDAIFISNDNTALSALPLIIKSAKSKKIPVFVSDTDAVELGSIAALGPNQYDVGKQTGRMISRLLRGEDMKKQFIEFPEKIELFINLDVAEDLGIQISQDLLKTAKKIISSKKLDSKGL